jgi:hypothetical protein
MWRACQDHRLISLSEESNVQTLPRCKSRLCLLRSFELYRLWCFGGVEADFASFIRGSHALSRVKFFVWLLSLTRIQTRDMLLRKRILELSECGCP